VSHIHCRTLRTEVKNIPEDSAAIDMHRICTGYVCRQLQPALSTVEAAQSIYGLTASQQKS